MGKSNSKESKLFQNISRKYFFSFANLIILGLIGTISWKFIASNMPPFAVGSVYFAMGYAGLFSFICDLGFGQAHIKKISEGKDLGTCLGTLIAIKIVLTVIFVVSIFSSIFFWMSVMGRGFGSQSYIYLIYIIMAYHIILQISSIGLFTLSAKIRTFKHQMPQLIGSIIQLIMTIIVVLLTDSAYLLGLTFVVGALANMLVSLFFIRLFPIKKPSLDLFKDYVKFAIPIFVISILAVLPINIDRVMIELFWNPESVSVYTGGQRYSTYLVQIPAGIGMILFPTFSALNSKKNFKKIKEVVYSSERLLAMIMAPICGLMFVLSPEIVTILGSTDYYYSYLILQPLSIWAFVRGMSTPYARLIYGIGRPHLNAIISGISIFLMISLNLIFIPPSLFGIPLFGLGAKGAAFATLISALFPLVFFRILAFKYQKVFLNAAIFKYIYASIFSMYIVFIFVWFFPVNFDWNIVIKLGYLFVFGFIGVLLYLVILVLIKGFSKKDVLFFQETLSPFKMLKYIKKELAQKKE